LWLLYARSMGFCTHGLRQVNDMKIAYEYDDKIIKIYTSIEQLVSDFNANLVLDTFAGYLRIMEEE